MPDNLVAAIHQPNFFPWLGFFHKIIKSDRFVLLDNVQMQKKGGTYVNRVQILIAGNAQWLTVPISRSYHGVRAINAIEFDDTADWRSKILRTIQMNYARAGHFQEIYPVLAELIRQPAANLGSFNIAAITEISRLLGIDTRKFVLASSLSSEKASTDLLIDLVLMVGAKVYLCGGGAGGYQEDEKFTAAGIELRYQNFQHPIYPQPGLEFVSGLSVIDALMHCGIEGTRALL